jgi:hypothetical protein
MDPNVEMMFKEINDRLAAIGQQADETKLRGMVEQQMALLMQDGKFARKMRFGAGGGDKKLVGSKYARFGLSVQDIEFLYDLQESLRGQKRVTESGVYEGPSETLRNAFAAISDAYYLPMDQVREMDQRALDGMFPRIPLNFYQGKDLDLARRGAWELTEAYQTAKRAMDTAESGYGSQLIGAGYVSDLWEASRNESRIFGLIESFEMRFPTEYLPVEVDFPEMLFVSESTASNSGNYTTSKTGSNRVQVDAKKFVIHQMWSGELEEDSILPFVPFMRRQQQLSIAYYSDSLALNGDTTNAATGNINLDDADPADTKHYLAFDGIRHVGIVDNTGNQKNLAGAITLSELRDAKGRMMDATNKVDWGHPNNPDDLVFAADPESADRIALLDEVIKYKQLQGQALLNGEVARAIGHPVISSIAVSKTEADGKVSTTAGNNTKGNVVPFNRRAFKAGWRRRIKIESERLPASDQTRIVLSMRMGLGRFTPTGAVSGIEGADNIFNISL